MKRTTISSEVITLNLETDFIKDKNITSMADYYIIGIYGSKNGTFQLTVSSQNDPVTKLENGVSLKHSQASYDVVYF